MIHAGATAVKNINVVIIRTKMIKLTKQQIFRILLIENFLFEFGAGLYGPIYAIYVERIGGTLLTAGIAWSIFLISLGVFGFVVSKFIDRFNIKKVTILTSILHALLIFCYVFVSNVYQLYLLQLLTGIIGAINFPVWDAWFTRMQESEKRGGSFALMHATNNLGRGLAALLGSSIAYFFGFKMLFIVSAVTVLISSLLLFILEEKS